MLLSMRAGAKFNVGPNAEKAPCRFGMIMRQTPDWPLPTFYSPLSTIRAEGLDLPIINLLALPPSIEYRAPPSC